MEECLFCRIVKGEIPTKIVKETEDILVFPDIHPQADTHLLIVPKKHIAEFADLTDGDWPIWEEMVREAFNLISESGLKEKGYRLVVNGGGAALINHLHLHLLGGITPERKV